MCVRNTHTQRAKFSTRDADAEISSTPGFAKIHMLPNQATNATEMHVGKVDITERMSVRGKYKDQKHATSTTKTHDRVTAWQSLC